MSDTPHKKATLGQGIVVPSSSALSHPSQLLRPQVVAQARGQDSILSGRRVLVSRQMGGSIDWLADSSGSGGVAQAHPDAVTWRLQYRARVEQQAGTALEVRALTVPSGATEFDNVSLGQWDPDGIGGQTRASITWTNEAVDTATEITTFATSQADGDGAEDTTDGAAWAQLRHHYAALVRPQAAANSLAEAAKWSEWPTLDVELADQGAARVVHLAVSEVPHEHVVADTVIDSTANGADPLAGWPIKRPQIEQVDGATYDEHRFGVHRVLAVAARQTERMGPRIAHWSSYTESGTGVSDVEAAPVSVAAAAGTVRVSAGSNTAWDADAVGWDVIGTQRMPEHTPQRIAGASSIPVRVRIYCRWSVLPFATTAVFRIQSSPRSFVEVLLDSNVIGTSFGWATATGWLEASIASDDTYPVMQDFLVVEDGTVEVRAFDVSYGDYPAPVP
jgi:hypothetical protein